MSIILLLTALALLRFGGQSTNFPAWSSTLVAPISFWLACTAGLTLPDIDQIIPIGHRSALTHSVLPALLLLFRRWTWVAAAGVALGIALHLSADLFPAAMIGYATVKMPFAGSLGSDSYLWLAGNTLLCGGLGLRLWTIEAPNWQVRLLALSGVIFVGVSYLLGVKGGFPALILLGLAGWLAWWSRARTGPTRAIGGRG